MGIAAGGDPADGSRGPVWRHLACDPAAVERVVQAVSVHPVVARLLVQRGLGDPAAAERFLHPSIDQLHDPFRLTDLARGVERLERAVARRERVAVHGDYDVDGITSTVMLRRALELLGADVAHYIPERLRDGYGLQPAGIERLHADGVRVVVSVDCGIRSMAAAERARALGVDLIITDHHEPDATLPPALAVINPRRPDCAYPDKDLAGVGVAFKLVQALCLRAGREAWLPGFIKLAAVGTLADVVPLRGENRIIAKVGLDRLGSGPNTVGLQALLDASGLTGRRIGGDEIAFRVAPRINAAGRMSSPDLATRLLLATGPESTDEARRLAETLDEENTRRRAEEATIADEARRRIEGDPTLAAHPLLVVWAEGWHRGVIGIVASKLVERFARPVLVLSVDGDEAHGSGRSIPGFDLLAALDACADLLIRHGGHRQAAGVVLDAARLPELRRRLTDYAGARLGPDDLVHQLTLDAPLPLTAIGGGLLAELNAMEPFGQGNRRPVFHAAPVELVDGPHMLKARHLRMTVRQGHARFRAIWWRASERAERVEAHRAGLSLAFSLAENSYQGTTFIELAVADAIEAR